MKGQTELDVMGVSQPTIDAAFERHRQRYAQRPRRAWDIPHHIECWRRAHRAFAEGAFDDFQWLYEGLKGYWQVFRGSKGKPWSARQVYDHLIKLDKEFRRKRLSRLTVADAEPLMRLLGSMSGIKRTKDGASVMALSKFLHFWNPRLFVIVDRAYIWNWVFAHSWLGDQVAAVRQLIAGPGAGAMNANGACDLTSYAAILLWSGALIMQNPGILPAFADYVAAHAAGTTLPSGLDEYEAPAVEWFLLGLVELSPGGVSLPAGVTA